MSVTANDVRLASERIRPLAKRTPVMTSRSFDHATGRSVYFKCENFQTGGAFKIRGAANFVFSTPAADRGRGFVAFSSGNHAQAVAIAAAAAGAKATVVMPNDAPRSKLEATRDQGAAVVSYDRFRENREVIARRIAEESGATVIPPFDHPWIVAGQGTAGMEFIDQVADLESLVIPLGGGGLLAGSALAARAVHPHIRIYGVEPEEGNDYWLSRQGNAPVEIPVPRTIADGLMTTKPGAVTFPLVQRLADDILLVSDAELIATMKFIFSRLKIVVEPSGAAAAAALLHGKVPRSSGRTGVILSGGNIDLERLAEWFGPAS